MKGWNLGFVLCVCALVCAAAPAFAFGEERPDPDSLAIAELAPPVSGQSLTPFLSSSEDHLYLSWLERRDPGHALLASRWDGAEFSEPSPVHESDAFFANWADFASVVPLADRSLVAHWLEKSAEGAYDYDVWVSLSRDVDAAWDAPRKLHRDGTKSEHGFVSLVPWGQSGFAATWLDGRQMTKGATDNEMSLMFTTFENGALGEEVMLDGRVCECCQTSMVATEKGLVVAYRGRSQEEIRDMRVTVLEDGIWSEPRWLHQDGWEIAGCPVNGPALAADGNRVFVSWFTASDEEPKVLAAFSHDGGKSFGEARRIDDGNPAGRIDVEILDPGAAVSWLERSSDTDEGARVRLRYLDDEGKLGASRGVANTSAGRASGFAQMTRYRGELYIAWTDAETRDGPSRVRVGRVIGP